MATWVAVTEIRHGAGSGELTVFEPGETVTGLDKETMLSLYASGSLAEKGSTNDPSTWVDESAEYTPTTPRLVEEVLRRQMFEDFGPGEVVTKTQSNQDAPKDPAKLLNIDMKDPDQSTQALPHKAAPVKATGTPSSDKK